ncbi:hypothetical protein IT072_13740 [Leifsonia sp. ZF2019]|uniref:hypothetical protein n=1 Tax=Leifsonia sp. ZF2019 TaxID=2781978 RepID=UPI001CBF7569|nr:hypothetical protein [Leifsonia sp. ZF2019]UAJ78321.1 hypothetical protein IT072_13740 [Leifsonia sp. ZF2019]
MGDNSMFTRGGIFIRNPRLRFVSDDGESSGGGDEGDKGGAGGETGFPANTPVKDMTPEQQAAYHLHQSRKHEGRVKAFGDWTPEKIAKLEKDNADLRTKTQSAEQNALDAAKEEGRSEIRAILAAERVKNALATALNGRIPDANALLELDRSRFIKDDAADTDAIAAWVQEHSTEASSGAQKKGGPDLGQGKRGQNQPAKGVGAGADLFAGTRKSKKTES